MPETNDKKHYPNPNSNSRNNNSNKSFVTISNRVRLGGQRQATDFTTTQELKLRAGDVRMARMQICLTKLRHDMEKSNKLIEQLCQEAHLEIYSTNK